LATMCGRVTLGLIFMAFWYKRVTSVILTAWLADVGRTLSIAIHAVSLVSNSNTRLTYSIIMSITFRICLTLISRGLTHMAIAIRMGAGTVHTVITQVSTASNTMLIVTISTVIWGGKFRHIAHPVKMITVRVEDAAVRWVCAGQVRVAGSTRTLVTCRVITAFGIGRALTLMASIAIGMGGWAVGTVTTQVCTAWCTLGIVITESTVIWSVRCRHVAHSIIIITVRV